MVTVIRQHVEGYVSFLMYGDNNTYCLMSYCKKNNAMKVTFRSDNGVTHLNYDNLHDNLVTDIMNMIALHMFDDETNIPTDVIKVTNICIVAIRRHVKRRVIKSLVKPYSKLSNFNPKNRRVISAK